MGAPEMEDEAGRGEGVVLTGSDIKPTFLSCPERIKKCHV